MDASSKISKIHHRMPVFLTESKDPKKNTKAMWLDPDISFG
jgi:putative SOS response-associated peptidase YedK